MTILIFVAILAVLVLVHEAGHFITAKAFGVSVLEFGVGYPPRLLGFRRGETLYSLNLLPLGGFVKLAGEDDPSAPGSFAGRGLLTRFTIIVAGAAMNALLPLFLFAVLLIVPQKVQVGKVALTSVVPDSPAAQAGLKAGDIITQVDGHPIGNVGDLSYRIRLKLGSVTHWDIERPTYYLTSPLGREPGTGGTPPVKSVERFSIDVTPRWRPPAGQGPTGVGIVTLDPKLVTQRYAPWEALPRAAIRLKETFVLFRNEIFRWIMGSSRPEIAGPIGIAQATGEVARFGWQPLLEWIAALSLNLAIFNVLPIPMLDGGRLLFMGIEFVRRGKRVPPEREALVHMIGLALLIGVIVVVSYFDILRILRGGSLLR